MLDFRVPADALHGFGGRDTIRLILTLPYEGMSVAEQRYRAVPRR